MEKMIIKNFQIKENLSNGKMNDSQNMMIMTMAMVTVRVNIHLIYFLLKQNF